MNQNLNILFLLLLVIFYPAEIFAHSRTLPMGQCEATINKYLRILRNQVTGTIPIEKFNQFRRAYNQGKIEGDNRFVMLNFRQPAKILNLNEHTLTLGIATADGRFRVIRALRQTASKFKSQYTSIYVSPEVRSFFDYFDSTVKTIPFIYSVGTRKSEELEEQGYPSNLYQGIDEVTHLVEFGKLLLESKFNPFQTHIVYFANQVSTFIDPY